MKYLSLLVLAITIASSMYGQQSINASGGNATQGNISFSIGQIAYNSVNNNYYSISEGVIQNYEVSTTSSIKEAQGIQLLIHTYPNPTTEYFTLKIENYTFSSLQFVVYDITGTVVLSSVITKAETKLETNNLKPGNYIAKISNNNKEIKSFTIIKL